MPLAGALLPGALAGLADLADCSGAQSAPESTFVLLDGNQKPASNLLVNKRGQIVKQYVGEPDFAALHRER